MADSSVFVTPEKETELVTNVYNKIAHHFKKTRTYSWDWITEFVTSIPRNGLIYDIGCGSGRNMKYDGYNFIGVDSSSEFVDMCIANKQNAVKASMTCLPFENKTADAIICIASFHHLSNKERRLQALYEMKRVVKDGCKILLSVWSKEQPKKTRRVFENYGDVLVPWTTHNGSKINRYYYIFEMEEIYKLFEIAGLRVVSHKWEVGNEVFVLAKSQ